jgi:hypothetical protein
VIRLQDLSYKCNVGLEKGKLHTGFLEEFQDQKIAPTVLLEKEHLRLKKIMGAFQKYFNEIKNEVLVLQNIPFQ